MTQRWTLCHFTDIMNQISVKTKVAQGGRIVIPAKFRDAMGLKTGNNVTLTLRDGCLHISTREAAFRRIEEMMKDKIRPGRSVVEELIRERREEAARE